MRAGVPTRGGARLPVIVSHDDVVVRLPEGAVLLASSAGAPVQAWRVGGLLALQHHPESTPARIEYWRARSAARAMSVMRNKEETEALPTSAPLEHNLSALDFASFSPALSLNWNYQPMLRDAFDSNWFDKDNWNDNGAFSATLAWNVTNMLSFSSNR